MEPELFLHVSVLIGGVPHHLGGVVFILLHPHDSLGHGAKLLGLLDEYLEGDVLIPECPGKLIPSDLSGVCMVITVTIPPGFCGSQQLMDCECHALLIRAVGQIQLGLDDLQPIISVHGVL